MRETYEVSKRYLHIRANISKATKENDEPKGGKKERTRKMARAKIINFLSIPVKLFCSPRAGDLIMACNSGPDDHMEGAAPQWPLSQTPVVALPLCKITGAGRGSFPGRGY